jgi:hypothetical protein
MIAIAIGTIAIGTGAVAAIPYAKKKLDKYSDNFN